MHVAYYKFLVSTWVISIKPAKKQASYKGLLPTSINNKINSISSGSLLRLRQLSPIKSRRPIKAHCPSRFRTKSTVSHQGLCYVGGATLPLKSSHPRGPLPGSFTATHALKTYYLHLRKANIHADRKAEEQRPERS